MRRRGWALFLLIVAAAWLLAAQWRTRFFAGGAAAPMVAGRSPIDRVGWLGSPGPLSEAHAQLSGDCQACHVPFRPVADIKCQACHTRNVELLDRRTTAFHAQATGCAMCHLEHRGRRARISTMEHRLLRPDVGCAACHVDRHQERFGDICGTCHLTETWKVAGYRHPPARSTACFECHAPPPSHWMMHFEMMDRRVTGQADATVDQCHRCHTTDHWNNIKGVGFFVHH